MNILKYWKRDLPASIVVFLVALPLCLGIALASGAPLFSGLIAGIVGGIVIGAISKSALSVSGPAAGLVVIVLGAIETLGSFPAFLTAVFIGGVLQLILGVVRAGVIGLYFPSSVIRGMLAAIGLILILKQIPHLFGFDTDAFGEMEFTQADGNNTFSYLAQTFDHITTGSMVIGLICLGLLILWGRPFMRKIPVVKDIPAGVAAVLVGLGLNWLFKSSSPELVVGAEHLVSLPIFSSDSSLTDIFTFPDWSILSNPQVYIAGVTLAIVASLETLLCIEAVDKTDPEKRTTDKNAELRAQGIGNMVSGLIGGLPITSVIVRSSANIDAGAKSKLSAILHGVLLVAAVAIFPRFMNQIPLAALAAILIMVGYKLAKPSVIKEQFSNGWDQFIPFATTVLAILFTDLLIGIIIGMGVGIFFILRANYRVPYYIESQGGGNIITLSEHVSFLNKARLQKAFDELPENSKIVIDGRKAESIDFDVLEVIKEFRETSGERGITCEINNLKL